MDINGYKRIYMDINGYNQWMCSFLSTVMYPILSMDYIYNWD